MSERDLTFNCPFDKKICVKSPGTPGNPPCPERLMAPFDENDSVFNPDNDTGRKCGRMWDWRLECERFQNFLNDECDNKGEITDAKMQKAIKTLNRLFNQLVFKNNTEKQILLDSYILNLKNMVLHSKQINQSPYDYIKTIQQELLKDPNIRKR